MRMPRLVQRRSLPVPTWAGAVLLVALLGSAALWAMRGLPRFLAPDDPVGHGLLVVEGWLDRGSLHLAATTFRSGGYDALVVSGGPTSDAAWSGGFATFAERAAAELRRQGIVEPMLVVIPAPASAQDRTYRSAVSVRQWLETSGRRFSALDVFSMGPHARRSRTLFRSALGDGIAVGVLSAPPSEYDLKRWWQSSAGVKDMLGETIAYGWVLCCFHPGPRGSHQESWAVPGPGGP